MSDLTQQKCAWSRIDKNSIERNTAQSGLAFQQLDGIRLRTGVELAYDTGWSLAGALGYDNGSDLRFDGNRATGTNDGLHIGVGARKSFGKNDLGTVSFGLTAGQQWVKMARHQSIFIDGLGRSRYTTN